MPTLPVGSHTNVPYAQALAFVQAAVDSSYLQSFCVKTGSRIEAPCAEVKLGGFRQGYNWAKLGEVRSAMAPFLDGTNPLLWPNTVVLDLVATDEMKQEYNLSDERTQADLSLPILIIMSRERDGKSNYVDTYSVSASIGSIVREEDAKLYDRVHREYKQWRDATKEELRTVFRKGNLAFVISSNL